VLLYHLMIILLCTTRYDVKQLQNIPMHNKKMIQNIYKQANIQNCKKYFQMFVSKNKPYATNWNFFILFYKRNKKMRKNKITIEMKK
jgi:hypothetical protein